MVPARSRGRTLPRSRGLAFVPFVVARAGGSIHFALFRRGEDLRGNNEQPGGVQKSTFSDDRQHHHLRTRSILLIIVNYVQE